MKVILISIFTLATLPVCVHAQMLGPDEVPIKTLVDLHQAIVQAQEGTPSPMVQEAQGYFSLTYAGIETLNSFFHFLIGEVNYKVQGGKLVKTSTEVQGVNIGLNSRDGRWKIHLSAGAPKATLLALLENALKDKIVVLTPRQMAQLESSLRLFIEELHFETRTTTSIDQAENVLQLNPSVSQ